MESSSVPSRLIVLFFLIVFAEAAEVATQTAAATKSGRLQLRRPGFLYTRSRGRCTPQFWSSRREEWPRMIPQTSSVSKIFGSRAVDHYKIDLTLLQAVERNDENNAYSSLLKQSSAALLNSYARRNFLFSAWEVKTLLIQALVSEEMAVLQAKRFSLANEACT